MQACVGQHMQACFGQDAVIHLSKIVCTFFSRAMRTASRALICASLFETHPSLCFSRSCSRTRTHAHTHARARAHTHAHTHTHVWVCVGQGCVCVCKVIALLPKHTHAHTQRMHACTHARAHTQTSRSLRALSLAERFSSCVRTAPCLRCFLRHARAHTHSLTLSLSLTRRSCLNPKP
jgi:hypothetical protein